MRNWPWSSTLPQFNAAPSVPGRPVGAQAVAGRPQSMVRSIAYLSSAAVLLLLLGACGGQPGDTTEATSASDSENTSDGPVSIPAEDRPTVYFVGTLKNAEPIFNAYTAEELARFGQAVCVDFDAGYDAISVSQTIAASGMGFSPEEAGLMVGLAPVAFCPEHIPKIEAVLTSPY